jgi:MFS family permease
MRAWGAGVSAGYVILGVIGGLVLHVPGAELLFGLCAVVTLALALVAAPLLQPRRREDDDGGIATRRTPDEPPPWWPEFEREFRAYVERLTSVRG